MTDFPRIYLFVGLDIFGDLVGFALAEDGTLLAQHPFPSAELARKRMERRAKIYREHYPDYSLVWVEDIYAEGPWQEASRRNKDLWDADRPRRTAEAAVMEAKAKRFVPDKPYEWSGAEDIRLFEEPEGD
jgi:hypothetical protein